MPTRSVKNLTDRQLTTIDLKKLHEMMDKAGLSEEQQEEVRARRRKLQNRNSAKTSAARKRMKFESLTQTNERLNRELGGLAERVARLESANGELRRQVEGAKRAEAQALHENEIYRREITLLTSLLNDAQARNDGMTKGNMMDPAQDWNTGLHPPVLSGAEMSMDMRGNMQPMHGRDHAQSVAPPL